MKQYIIKVCGNLLYYDGTTIDDEPQFIKNVLHAAYWHTREAAENALITVAHNFQYTYEIILLPKSNVLAYQTLDQLPQETGHVLVWYTHPDISGMLFKRVLFYQKDNGQCEWIGIETGATIICWAYVNTPKL